MTATSTHTSAAATGAALPHQRRRPGLGGAIAERWPTALGITATSISLAVLAPVPASAQTWITAWSVLLAAVIYLTWGTARGELNDWRWLAAQTAAVLALGGIAIAGVAVDPAASRYILAAGWLAHAAWDVAHHRADRVVPRWYAETCMVCDLIIATVLLLVGSV